MCTAVACGGGWFGLSSFFLGRQYATLGPEALCWEGLLGTILAAVRVFRNRSSQLFSAMGLWRAAVAGLAFLLFS